MEHKNRLTSELKQSSLRLRCDCSNIMIIDVQSTDINEEEYLRKFQCIDCRTYYSVGSSMVYYLSGNGLTYSTQNLVEASIDDMLDEIVSDIVKLAFGNQLPGE